MPREMDQPRVIYNRLTVPPLVLWLKVALLLASGSVA